ncbi:MAG: heme o synthase [Phycisphaerales bacterium]|jgi:protoheme IX farnesyltransferase|nr:heme o synthase [Phycisphaerales bacterium]
MQTTTSPDIIDEIEHAEGAAAARTTATTTRHATPARWVDFYELTKPRMNFLVLVTTLVGFYMATGPSRHIHWALLFPALIGTALCAAGASVLNQFIERDLDKLMPRTRNRPVPAGRIAPGEALVAGIVLGASGVITLALFVNVLTALLGVLTLLSYVLIYTPLKRKTTLNTVIGAIPGAIPPVMGFTAVDNALSPAAIALFAILFIWQMPHFLAIAILFKRDYALAGFKMLPVVDEDLSVTGRQIVLYSVALVPVTLMPVQVGLAGQAYFAVALMLGLAFLSFGISCATSKTRLDARKLFFASIIYLPALLGVMMLDRT